MASLIAAFLPIIFRDAAVDDIQGSPSRMWILGPGHAGEFDRGTRVNDVDDVRFRATRLLVVPPSACRHAASSCVVCLVDGPCRVDLVCSGAFC